MKDSLFELLMDFFEKTLTQIKEKNAKSDDLFSSSRTAEPEALDDNMNRHHVIAKQNKNIMRVFTPHEQFKFTKASYQFIMRLMRLDIISAEIMEEIIHQLSLSDSPFVTLQETKWAIRNLLIDRLLDPRQVAFLDMVLYQQEDKLLLH